MPYVKTVIRKGFDIRIHRLLNEFGIFYEFDIVTRDAQGKLLSGPMRYKEACFDSIEELMPTAIKHGNWLTASNN